MGGHLLRNSRYTGNLKSHDCENLPLGKTDSKREKILTIAFYVTRIISTVFMKVNLWNWETRKLWFIEPEASIDLRKTTME